MIRDGHTISQSNLTLLDSRVAQDSIVAEFASLSRPFGEFGFCQLRKLGYNGIQL